MTGKEIIDFIKSNNLEDNVFKIEYGSYPDGTVRLVEIKSVKEHTNWHDEPLGVSYFATEE